MILKCFGHLSVAVIKVLILENAYIIKVPFKKLF